MTLKLKPICDAPKDGTMLILFGEGQGFEGPCLGWWQDDGTKYSWRFVDDNTMPPIEPMFSQWGQETDIIEVNAIQEGYGPTHFILLSDLNGLTPG